MNAITITEALIFNAGAIVFSAGVLWTKVNNLEKKIDQHATHPERLAKLETKVESIENSLQ